MTNSLRVLYVVNKKLPPGDYRICYGKISEICKVRYGMPGKTEGLADSSYVNMGFDEGWRFSYLLDFIRLYLYLRTHRQEVDLVHFYSTNLILFGPIVAYFARIRSVVTLTGFGRVFSRNLFMNVVLRPIYRFFLEISIRLSWRFLLQNQTDLNLLSSRYSGQVSKFVYVGSAVDFPQIQQKDFSVPNLKVILIARLMPDKGISDFIRVAEELSGTSWEFILIGPSSKGFDDLYKQVLEYNDHGIISYKGECSSEEIKKELAQSHIFYFPSHGEGLSRTMLEAGFALLCPIAYDIPANKDLIVTGRGFLVPKRDTEEVIRILGELSKDRLSLEQNASAYQAYIVENYNIEIYTRRMDEILLEIRQKIR